MPKDPRQKAVDAVVSANFGRAAVGSVTMGDAKFPAEAVALAIAVADAPAFDPAKENAVRVLRKAKGWSQSRLAAEVVRRVGLGSKCSIQHVSMWERGESNPGSGYLPAVAIALDVDPVRLVSWLNQFKPSK